MWLSSLIKIKIFLKFLKEWGEYSLEVEHLFDMCKTLGSNPSSPPHTYKASMRIQHGDMWWTHKYSTVNVQLTDLLGYPLGRVYEHSILCPYASSSPFFYQGIKKHAGETCLSQSVRSTPQIPLSSGFLLVEVLFWTLWECWGWYSVALDSDRHL